MKLRARIYIILISLIGMAMGIMCVYQYFMPFITGEAVFSWPMLAIPVLVCSLCRSLPITIKENETLDLSVISVLAVYLTQGARAAVTVYMISSLFTFEPSSQKKKYKHLFSIGPQKVLFNDSTIILSIVLPALLVSAITKWSPGNIALPGSLIPTALFSLFTFVVNGVLQMSMFCLNNMITPGEMVRMLFGLAPNVIAAMPMGLLIGLGYSSEGNVWVVFVMLFPLFLARYAWKLYLDSERARTHLITAFIHSIEAKDKYTQGHSERVSEYSVQIAQQLKLPKRQIQLIRQGAILHDIGKIGIPDQILNKPGRLDDEEFKAIHEHPLIGVKILKEVGLEEEVLEMVRSHHERFDGKGYPEGRGKGELTLASRILCVADAYDAMTSDRPYRKGMELEKVKQIM
ncbi:MAG: HD-GYP domain-containing protein, partial [Clostridia bacterium]|nr:HD-GYP domain-containing protein [Clostridia bacterium]